MSSSLIDIRNLGLIPKGTILFVQWNQFSIGFCSCRSARIGQQHQREQSRHLSVLRKQSVQTPRQPDRFPRQFQPLRLWPTARGIAFVENQVQHVQHGREPLLPLPMEASARLGQ